MKGWMERMLEVSACLIDAYRLIVKPGRSSAIIA